ERDPRVVQAAFCAPAHARHVFRTDGEGAFCGYRNIQMLITHLQGASRKGRAVFGKRRLPTIIELQDMIEEAWDAGFNTIGREDTGGIRGTRKYIGTSEAQALFESKGFRCQAQAIFSKGWTLAYSNLLSRIWEYFLAPGAHITESKVITTQSAPVYLQHDGHSMTIVGIEKFADGSDVLVVLDPGTKPVPEIRTLVDAPALAPLPRVEDCAAYLQAYRRGREYLSKYNAFEILTLETPR
ncbi:hypothetical protein KEM52_004089, partial [Ascosphaera acerosa]